MECIKNKPGAGNRVGLVIFIYGGSCGNAAEG
jgi:hypothetical protein